jgi:F-type H+-transporting ATPase subunit gamma
MPTAREVKNRIKSVQNIAQITRAMEAVSVSLVRKAQARVLASRAFSEKAWEILLNVQSTATKGVPQHPLLTARDDVKQVMIVLVTADRGLAGAYNTNIVRVGQRFAERLGKPVRWVTIGRKGRDTLVRQRENVIAEFSDLPADPTLADIAPVARLAIEEFLNGTVDQVFIAYTDFINTLTQRPVVLGWLPLIPYHTEDQVASEFVKSVPEVTNTSSDYEIEPSPEAILSEIVPRFTELQLYQAVLESQASEHSARMVAMRNASENAEQLKEEYTLVYNKARQSAITAEILDIVGGAEALQSSMDKLADQILAGFRQAEADAALRSTYSAPMNEPNGKKPEKKSRKKESDGQAPAVSALAQPAPTALAEPPPHELTVAETSSAQPATESGSPVVSSGPAGDGAEDDLTVVEGIGKKMSAALKAAGIRTYAQLAQASEADLHAAIEAAGMRFAPTVPTWAEQASYAARGDWEGLDAFQKTLTGGRKKPDGGTTEES